MSCFVKFLKEFGFFQWQKMLYVNCEPDVKFYSNEKNYL